MKPVAWMSVDCVGDRYLHFSKPLDNDPVQPLYTAPVHASDISAERVDEKAKLKHEPVAWHEPGAYGNVTTHKDWALANGWEPLYKERT
jgi:hypothetical protein